MKWPVTSTNMFRMMGGGGAGVIHVIRDLPNIFNVNFDLHIFFNVKRDWGYLRETWCVIYYLRDLWLRHIFPCENYTDPTKFTYKTDIIHVWLIIISTINMIPHLFSLDDFPNCRCMTLTCMVHVLEHMTTMYCYAQSGIERFWWYFDNLLSDSIKPIS